jgi:hypothetical protein
MRNILPTSVKDFTMVAIAQLVEPRIVIPVVVGSSPISHPILKLLKRRVAQLGSATGLGPVGRRFESSLADHSYYEKSYFII